MFSLLGCFKDSLSAPARVVHPASSPVSEGCDDQPRRVAQVLVGIPDLGITDVGKAVLLLLIPTMPELRLPGEGLGTFHLPEVQGQA